MTLLLFEVARQRYGLDVSQIVEVVPAVRLRSIPGVPPYVAGIMQYRGSLAPVLDVSQLLCGTPAAPRFSTRLVMVRHYTTARTERVLGLLVERATQGVSDELGDLMSSGIATPDHPFLGKIAVQRDESVQLLTVERLIPEELRARLFVES